MINESVINQFEHAWHQDEPQAISSFLAMLSAEELRPTLEELICIELKFAWDRWRVLGQKPERIPKSVLDYILEFPVLQTRTNVLRVLQEEEKYLESNKTRPVNIDRLLENLKDWDLSVSDLPPSFVKAVLTSNKTVDLTQHDSARDRASGSSVDWKELLEDESVLETHSPIRELDHYLLLERIGVGGMGVVYKSFDKKLKRFVAVKMLRRVATGTGNSASRLVIEAKAIAQLNHPGIVKLFEVGTSETGPYLVMELIEGGDLKARMKAEELFDFHQAAELIGKLAIACAHCHEHGVVHRDIKPANILFNEQSEPVLTDFGLAKDEQFEQQLTLSGDIIGTPAFMPPEQITHASKSNTPQIDIYSLGAVLYQLLVGRPPFLESTTAETVRKVTEGNPVPPRAIRATIPRDLNTICMKCLASNPSQRYESADLLHDDLHAFVQGRSIAARPMGLGERSINWCKRNPLRSLISGFAVILLMAIFIFQFLQNRTLFEHGEQLQERNHLLALAKQESMDHAIASDRSEYVATINLTSKDIERWNFEQAQNRLVDLSQRQEDRLKTVQGVEWDFLQNNLSNAFVRISAPPLEGLTSARIKSFAFDKTGETILYSIEYFQTVKNEEGDTDRNSKMYFQLFDIARQQFMFELPKVIEEEVPWSQDGPLIESIGPSQFLVGSRSGLFLVDFESETQSAEIAYEKWLDGQIEAIYTLPSGRGVLIAYRQAVGKELKVEWWQQNASDETLTLVESYHHSDLADESELPVHLAVNANEQFLALTIGQSLVAFNLQSAAAMGNVLAENPLSQQRPDLGMIKDVTCFRYGDRDLIAFAGHNKLIEVYELDVVSSNLERVNVIGGHLGMIQSLDFDPASGVLISGSNDRTVQCQPPFGNLQKWVLDEHSSEVMQTEIFGDKLLASCSLDGTLILRNRFPYESVTLGQHIPTYDFQIRDLQPLAKHQELIVLGASVDRRSDSGVLLILDANTHTVKQKLPLQELATRIAVSNDQSSVVIALRNGMVLVVKRIPETGVWKIALARSDGQSPETQFFKAAHCATYCQFADAFFVAGLLEDGQTSGVAKVTLSDSPALLDTQIRFEQPAIRIQSMDEHHRLLVGLRGRTGRVVPQVAELVFEGNELQSLGQIEVGFPSTILDLVYHKSESTLLLTGDDSDLKVLELPREAEPLTTGLSQSSSLLDKLSAPISYVGHFYGINRCVAIPSEQRCVTLGLDGQLIFWDLETNEQLLSYRLEGKKVGALVLNPSNQELIVTIDDRIVFIPITRNE